MIKDFLNRKTLAVQVDMWRQLAEAAVEGLEQNTADAEKLRARGWRVEDARALLHLVEKAEAEFKALPSLPEAVDEDDSDGAAIESAPALSALQTLMEDANFEAGCVVTNGAQGQVGGMAGMTDLELKPSAKPPEGQRLFYSPFDEPGALYLTEGAKAIAYRVLHGRHDFSTTPASFPLARRARLVLVGDWGTGVGRAQEVAHRIRGVLDEDTAIERHVIHLGDIYFAGWSKECQKRFLDFWPVRTDEARVHSWCLNGNHDMYCGGDGYFDTVLGDARFARQNGCSYFLLGNEQWQVIGMDTAYEEWALSNDQAAWALAERKKLPLAKGVLLTHHQPHSAYEGSAKSARVAADAGELLEGGRTTAWIWGHEHRCVIYDPITIAAGNGASRKIPFGACLGHGGVPAKPTRETKPGVRYALTEIVKYGLEKFGMMGFAVLDLDGDRATLTCIDELGNRKSFSVP